MRTKEFGTRAISLLGACDLQQMSQQGEQRVRRQIVEAFVAAVRQHHAALAAGNFYQARPVMPEYDICVVVATKLGPRRRTPRHRFTSPPSPPLLLNKVRSCRG